MYEGVQLQCGSAATEAELEADRVYPSWWREMRKREHKFLSTGKARPLDRVDVGKSMNMQRFLERREEDDPEWAQLLHRYMKGGFPRLPGNPTSEERHVRREFSYALKELAAAGIIGRIGPEDVTRDWVSYFQVPKTATHDRAIFNCTDTNANFEKPPGLRLCEISLLLGLCRRFGSGTWLSTADLRHFFWQIPLPMANRRHFTIRIGSVVYELEALPMGWSWSPWAAQGVAALTAIRAMKRIGWTAAAPERDPEFAVSGPPSAEEDRRPPPFLTVRDAEGELRGFIVIWYDNFLVITRDEADNNTIRLELDTQMRTFNIKYKRDEATRLAWTVAQAKATYIGIEIEHAGGVFRWRHAAENVQEWAKVGALTGLDTTLAMTAKRLGVLVWDATVRLGIARRKEIAGLASEVGRLFATGKGNPDNIRLRVTEGQRTAINAEWRRLLDNAWASVPSGPDVTRVFTFASDSSSHVQAGVFLQDCRHHWIWEADGKTINPLEYEAAIWTVWKALPLVSKGSLIALGVDNTSAVAWLQGRGCPDEWVENLRFHLMTELRRRGITLAVFWIPTNKQPADNLTRHKELDTALVAEIDRLLRKLAQWHLVTRPIERSHHLGRTQRDDDEV